MYQNQPPLQGMANEMAGYGRYGDSMLVHMNPMEVQGIAALSPTGELTTNPVTGQPEAFLPFLAPLLGSFLGSTFLTGAGAGALGGLIGSTGLSSAAAGAIGSGLATTAATGDIKKGLLSGITGFGLGKALGSAFDTTSGVQTAQAGVDAAEATLQDAIKTAATTPSAEAAKLGIESAQAGVDAAQKGLGDAIRDLGPAGRASAITGNLGTVGRSLIQPMNLAAIGVGEGKIAEIEAMEDFERDARRFEEEQEAERQRALDNIDAAYARLGQDYQGYNLPRYAAAGGVTSINPQHYADSVAGLQALAGAPIQMFRGGQTAGSGQGLTDEIRSTVGAFTGLTGTAPTGRPGAAGRQAMIRGSEVISPQELQGYRPGFAPEIQYFRRPTQDTTPDPTPTPGPGFPPDYTPPTYPNIDLGLGGFDINEYLETEAGQETVGSLRDVLGIPDFSDINERLDAIQDRPETEIDYDRITETVREGINIPNVDLSGLEGRLADLEGRGIPSYDDSALMDRLADLENRDFPSFDDSALQERLADLENRELPGVDLSGIEERLSGLENMPGVDLSGIQDQIDANRQRFDEIPQFDASELQAQIDANRESLGSIPAFDDTDLRSRLEALETAPGFDASGLESLISANTQAISDIPILTPDQLADIQSRGVVTPQIDPLQAMQDKLGATPPRGPRPTKAPPEMKRPPKRGRGPGFAEGGDTMIEETAMTDTMESNGQLLIDRAVMAISGQLPEDQAETVVAAFIDEFGPEAYQMLREKVLEEIVPGSQKEGEIRGPGGGMDDMIPGMIGDSQPVAVSPGEYIVPADVVSGLGDGSTDAGVGELDRMLDRVRQERTGTTRQPAPMSVGGALPA